MIQVYTGNGKGKTTAAIGLAVRAVGHDYRVRIIQFMKGSTYSGELNSALRLGIEVFQFGRTCPHAAVIKSGFMKCQSCGECWIGLKSITDLDRQKIQMGWKLAQDTVSEGIVDLLVLDEIMNTFGKGLLAVEEVVDWLKEVPDDIEVVLTGRNAPMEMIEHAHLVSEVKEIKHPFQLGIKSRRGIEY